MRIQTGPAALARPATPLTRPNRRDGWRAGPRLLDRIARKRTDLFTQRRGGLANDFRLQVFCIRIGVGLRPPPPIEIMPTYRLAQKSDNFGEFGFREFPVEVIFISLLINDPSLCICGFERLGADFKSFAE